MNIPDTRPMLPGKARVALIEYIITRMSERLDYTANPRYDIVAFFKDLETIGDPWTETRVYGIFQEAREKFDARYPKRWDNERQKTFRQGLPYPKT